MQVSLSDILPLDGNTVATDWSLSHYVALLYEMGQDSILACQGALLVNIELLKHCESS